jgi:hypothetical protein
VAFHPALKPFARSHSHALICRLLVRRPDNPLLAKVEGMLRFHIKGERPLKAQEWPKCLAEYKVEFLEALDPGVERDSKASVATDPPASTRGGIQHEAT